MGAPGVYNWKGSVVRFASYSEADGGGSAVRRRRRRAVDQSSELEEQDMIDAERTDVVEKYDYFGEQEWGWQWAGVRWHWDMSVGLKELPFSGLVEARSNPDWPAV